MSQKDKEIDELKSKIAEVMAVMPPTTSSYSSLENSLVSSILYNSQFRDTSGNGYDFSQLGKSRNVAEHLDPNACSYNSNGVSQSDL